MCQITILISELYPLKRCSGLVFGTLFGRLEQYEKLSEYKPTEFSRLAVCEMTLNQNFDHLIIIFFQVSKKYVSKDLSEQIHKKAEPFLTWLKDAEEESESEVIYFLFFDYLKKGSLNYLMGDK